MTLPPLEHYRRDLDTNGFQPDAAQESAVRALQELYDSLLDYQNRSRWQRFREYVPGWLGGRSAIAPRGLYLWGGVGRGKTYLMDTFFEALPFANKKRTHFHRFMRRVHRDLREIAGVSDPLESVADKLASETLVICFDEFFVSDITDAMLLAGLLKALFSRGVVLVTTSNIPPDELYKDGLQRARFLPAIDLLKRHTAVLNVDGGVDYRLRTLEQAELYHTPPSEKSRMALEAFFNSMTSDDAQTHEDIEIEIEGRHLRVVRESEDVVWFDFPALCDGPRSQNDYIELAREYHAVIVENVPIFDGKNDDQARRFINLVDEFYDRGVKLIMSAMAPIEGLYQQGRLSFEFDRTISRVLEMQSTTYLARAHKA